MAREKGSHPGRIRLARAGVRLRREQQLIEGLGGADGEHRQVDHRGSPKLPVGKGELKPEAAHRIRRVADIGLAAPEREAADHRHTPRSKDDGLRETGAAPVTFEDPRHAHALSVVATEAGVESIDVLERIGEPRGRQITGSETPPGVEERAAARREHEPDHRQPGQHAGLVEWPHGSRNAHALTLGGAHARLMAPLELETGGATIPARIRKQPAGSEGYFGAGASRRAGIRCLTGPGSAAIPRCSTGGIWMTRTAK